MSFNRDEAEKFQSALPVRGATLGRQGENHPQRISIRAPRKGSDMHIQSVDQVKAFQSALPVRGATAKQHKRHA